MIPDEKVPYEDQQIGIPGKGTETEAEKEFKKLVDQQMNISNTAGEKKVNFITSTREIMGTASGFMTLNQFQKVSESDKKANEFQSLGFTDLQIGVILQQEGITDIPMRRRKRKHPEVPEGPLIGPLRASDMLDEGEEDTSLELPCFMPHPDFISQSITELRQLQGKRDAELFAAENAGPQMSRHMLQLEAALLQGKTHLPLAHIYVNGAKKFSQQLDIINASCASVNKILLPGSVEFNEPQTVPKSPPSSPQTARSSLLQTNGKEKPETKNGASKATHGEEKVVISGKVESISDSAFEAGRRSAEELANEFPKYNVGTPSKIDIVCEESGQ